MRLAVLFALAFLLHFSGFAQKEVSDTCFLRIESISSNKKKAIEYDKASELAWKRGAYNIALDYADRGLKICKNGEFPASKAKLLNNKGIANDYLGILIHH